MAGIEPYSASMAWQRVSAVTRDRAQSCHLKQRDWLVSNVSRTKHVKSQCFGLRWAPVKGYSPITLIWDPPWSGVKPFRATRTCPITEFGKRWHESVATLRQKCSSRMIVEISESYPWTDVSDYRHNLAFINAVSFRIVHFTMSTSPWCFLPVLVPTKLNGLPQPAVGGRSMAHNTGHYAKSRRLPE